MTSRLAGTSSSTRTLDQRDLAALRPAAPPKPRKPRSAPVKREVTSGIVCFCGERFAEAQALEFMLHLRAEVGHDLQVLDNRRKYAREYQKQRRQDPEVAARRHESQRRYYERNKERIRAREKARYYEMKKTPEGRERLNAPQRKYRARLKAERATMEP